MPSQTREIIKITEKIKDNLFDENRKKKTRTNKEKREGKYINSDNNS